MVLAVGAAWLCGAFGPDAVRPQPSQQLLQAAQGLDETSIDAVFDPQERTVTVTQRMTLVNRTGTVQPHAVLRAWPNAFQTIDTSPAAAIDLYAGCYLKGFSAGRLQMHDAQANGSKAVYRYADEMQTVLQVPVEGGWQPDEAAQLTLSYTIHVPHLAYRFGEYNDVWSLGNAFLIPAVWQDGAYRMDEYVAVGDPFVSDCMNYTVQVTVPDGYACAGSAVADVHEDGRVWRFEAYAVRDFALVIGKGMHTARAVQDGVLLTAFAQSDAYAGQLVRCGAQALDFFGERYGAYPYPTLTLTQNDFPMGGMEYPALVMIATDMLEAGGRELEYVVAHEVAHQWWYAVVGSDAWYQSWQDEALCEFSVLEYMENVHGAAARTELEQRRIEPAMRVTVPRGVTPGAPLDTFVGMAQYSLVVYNRGAAMFCALDRLLDGGLHNVLRAYYDQYAFGRATREDFETLLAQVTGVDALPLMRDYLDTYILN